MNKLFIRLAALGAAWALATAATPALAQTAPGGVITIDQARAEAGGITPGDTPGFPVTISQPGSYRLSGNLNVGGPGITAVHITANHVTLDLDGFSVIGVMSCTGSSPNPIVCQTGGSYPAGIYSFGTNWVTVRNGKVRGFYSGVALDNRAMAEGLDVADTVDGIRLGQLSQARGNTVHTASSRGIFVPNGVVRENFISNTATGVMSSTAGLVERNRIHSVGTAIRGYAGPATATGNLITYAVTPLNNVLQLGPNACDATLCH